MADADMSPAPAAAPLNGKRKQQQDDGNDDEIESVSSSDALPTTTEPAAKKPAVISVHKELGEASKILDARGRPLPGTKPEDFIRVNLTTIQREGIEWSMKKELSAVEYAHWHKHYCTFGLRNAGRLRYGGGIMAADMGLGKTIMLLYQLIGDMIQWSEEWRDKPGSWQQRIHLPARRTLVVCGKSHIHNAWLKDIQTRLDPRLMMRIYVYDDKDLDQHALEHADLVITTYQRVLEDLKNYVLPWETYRKRMKGSFISKENQQREWEHLRDKLVKELVCIKRVEQLGARLPLQDLPIIKDQLNPESNLICLPFLERGIFSQFWWRVIVDEAHELRNTGGKRYQAALLLAAANRWWSTGTPFNNNKGDFASAVTFLRHPGIVYESDGHRWKAIDQALDDCIFVETVQRIKQTRPELIEQEESLAYLKYECLEFELAFRFATEHEQQLHQIYVEQLKTVAQALESKKAGFGAVMFEDEEDPIVDPDDKNKTTRKKEGKVGAGGLTAHARNLIREEVYTALESGESEAAMLLKYYTRARQACVLPSFADPKLLDTELPCYHLGATKIQKTVAYIRDRVPKDDKILVFSMFVETLKALKEALKRAGITSTIYSGGVLGKDRDANLAEFQAAESKYRVLLMSEKAGNTGLTVTQANWVIFFDPWFNPQVEEQAKKRVYRMGQQKPVRVLRFIIAGSIEEMVRKNAKGKLREANDIMSKKGAANPKFSASEVINQLTYLERTTFAERDEEADHDRHQSLKKHFHVLPKELVSKSVACLVPWFPCRNVSVLPPRSCLWRIRATDSSAADLNGFVMQTWRMALSDGFGNGKSVQLDWLRSFQLQICHLVNTMEAGLQRCISSRIQGRERVQRAAQDNANKRPDLLIKAIEAARKLNEQYANTVTTEVKSMLQTTYHLELYLTPDNQPLESGRHFEGRYSEANAHANDDYITLKGQTAKDLVPRLEVALDTELLLLFSYAFRTMHRTHAWSSSGMLRAVLSVNAKYARDRTWTTLPASVTNPLPTPPKKDPKENELSLIEYSSDISDYLEYTSRVLVPAMLSGDPCIATVAACAFHLVPAVLPVDAQETPNDPHHGRQFALRMWFVRVADEERIIGIACSIVRHTDYKRDGGYAMVFVPGAYVIESHPLASRARNMLEKELIQRGLFSPEELKLPDEKKFSFRNYLHNAGVTPGFAQVLKTVCPNLSEEPANDAGSDADADDAAAAIETQYGIGAYLLAMAAQGRKKFVINRFLVK
jgi:SNF2 family DNA or RNA helicase